VTTHHRYASLADALGATYGAITSVVGGLPAEEFELRTRTDAWNVKELLFHQLLDAQRALVGFATPEEGPADVTAVTYWRAFNPARGEEVDASGHARFVRVAASAYAGSSGLVSQWTTTSEAAARAAKAVGEQAFIGTQGHVLTVDDFVHTLLVEAAVHYLDLTLAIPAEDLPEPALDAVLEVLVGLVGRPLPDEWTATEAILKGTGREELTAEDRALLGECAAQFPLFG
jgi:Mycothiol maleylpyruvate isomerase N-terminal domain